MKIIYRIRQYIQDLLYPPIKPGDLTREELEIGAKMFEEES